MPMINAIKKKKTNAKRCEGKVREILRDIGVRKI